MASSFLNDFMKKREKAVTNIIVSPVAKHPIHIDSVKSLPNSNRITLGFIVENKPKPKLIVEYLERRRDEIIEANDSDY
jgi:hypothetical protein